MKILLIPIERFTEKFKPDDRKKETGDRNGGHNPEQFFINVT